MSSRLFQNVREKQGFVYSIFSELNPYRDTGCLAVYAGTSKESAPKVVQSVLKEFRNLKDVPVTTEELVRAKAQLKGSLMLSLESSMARMSNLDAAGDVLRSLLRHERDYRTDEAVSVEDVQQVAREFFVADQIAVTVLGNLTGLKLSRDQIDCSSRMPDSGCYQRVSGLLSSGLLFACPVATFKHEHMTLCVIRA